MHPKGLVVVAVVLAFVAGFWFALSGAGSTEQAAPPTAAKEAGDAVAGSIGAATGALPASDPGHDPVPAGAERLALEVPQQGGSASLSLRGRLVDAKGQPRADVELRLRSWTGLDGLDGLELPLIPGRDRDLPADRTDARGGFSFRVDRGRTGVVEFSGSELVFATGEPRFSAIKADVDLGDLVAIAASTISGTVRDARGQPLADVGVMASPDGVALGLRSTTKTDARGHFEVHGLHAGEWQLRTASGSYLPAVEKVQLVAEEHRQGVDIVLAQGAAIAGQVVDDRGVPVAGIKVGSKRREERGEVSVERFVPDEATETDASGWFTLAGLSGDAVSVRAFGSGYSTAVASNVAVGTGNLQLVVQRLASVAGVLRDTSGNPIAGSRVRARGGSAGPGGMHGDLLLDDDLPILPEMAVAETAADGSFRIENVTPGTVSVTARGRGHRPVSRSGVQVLPAQAVEGIALVAEVGAVARVQVVDESGAPVAGAMVTVTEPPQRPAAAAPGRRVERRMRVEADDAGDVRMFNGGRRQLGAGTTGADGVAEIGGLPAGPASVGATHDERAEARPADVVLPARGAVEVRLALRRPGFAELTVATPEGAPAAVDFVVHGPMGANEDERDRSGRTDGAGLARVGPLPSGDYWAELSLPPPSRNLGGAIFVGGERRALPATRVPFQVSAGQSTAVGLRMPVLTRVFGTVTGADGPAAGVAIELVREEEAGATGRSGLPELDSLQARSGEDGAFAIDAVEPGRYQIRWSKPDQVVKASMPIDVLPNLPEHRVDLELRYGKLRVQVVAKDGGDGIEGAEVELVAGDASGRPAAQPRRVMMVSMTMTDGNAGGETTTMTMGAARAKTDVDGVAQIDDVPPGTWTLRVRDDGHVTREVPGQVVVEGSTTDSGRVALDAAGRIRGRVVAADGQQAGMAMVYYKRTGTTEEQPEPALGGNFTLRGLAAGRYALRAESLADGSIGPEVEVDVVAGRPTTGVELRLR